MPAPRPRPSVETGATGFARGVPPQARPSACAASAASTCVKSLALAEGRLSLRGVLTTLEVRTVDLDPARLANVNTPDDLARIEPSPA